MALVSGFLYYDSNRSASVGSYAVPIANVPIVLQNTISGLATAVLTNSSGAFSFTNVPIGSYQVVEKYGFSYNDGTVPATIGSIDYTLNAVTTTMLNGGTVPPLRDENYTYVTVPMGSTITSLDCTVRNTWLETVGSSDITNINMLNGPVRISPLILDPNIVVYQTNLVLDADNGTFGSFIAGTIANTGAGNYPASQGPYPEIASMFLYTQPDSTKVTPPDGSYTVQNIMNNAHSNLNPTPTPQNSSWWRVADHTVGNEMGRMMVVNGYTAGYVIGKTSVTVEANTNYLTSYWILNLCKQSTGYVNPEFSAVILDVNGGVIYSHDFSDEIGVNTECPEWVQIGTIFNTGDNTEITVEFISQGGPQTGNDYVLDDVALNKVDILELNITKAVSCDYATAGGTLYYSVSIENLTDYLATQIILTDVLDNQFDDLEFTLDGENWLGWEGVLYIDDLNPGDSGEIVIKGKIKQGMSGIITNSASVEAVFCVIE